jgi:hypothetical protein
MNRTNQTKFRIGQRIRFNEGSNGQWQNVIGRITDIRHGPMIYFEILDVGTNKRYAPGAVVGGWTNEEYFESLGGPCGACDGEIESEVDYLCKTCRGMGI